MESYLLLSSERVIEEGEKREQRKKQAKKKKSSFLGQNKVVLSFVVVVVTKRKRFRSRFRFFFVFFLLSSLLFDFTNTMGLRASKPKDTANGTAHQQPQTPGGLRVRRFELFFLSLSLSLSLWKAKSSLSSSKCFLTLSLTSLLLHTKLTSKLLRKLEVSNGSGGGAQFSLSSSKHQHQQRQSPPLPSSSSSSSPSPTTQADHYYLQAKPELTQLLQTATKYNEALLKHEQNEIDSLAKYIKEIETVEKNPYEEDYKSESAREKLRAAKSKLEISSRKVKECFEKESSSSETLPTRCRAVVVQYEKCGQEALEAFVAARSE